MGTAAVALAAIGWGTWALFLRGTQAPPQWTSVMLLTVIGLVWLPAALRSRSPRSAWPLLAVAALTDAGNYVCYFGALARGPIALCVLTHYLAPVIVAVFAPSVLREPLGRRTPLALVASLAGLGLLVLGDGGLPRAALMTAVLGAASAVFYGANTLVTKKLFGAFTQSEVLSYHCLGAAVLLALTAGSAPPPLTAFLWMPVAGALLVGACGAALFYFGLARITAQRAAVLTYLEPLVAALVGAAAFGERLGPMGLLGGAFILAAGLWVATAPESA